MVFFRKLWGVLPPDQYIIAVLIVLSAVVGAALEAVGIGAILPLISALGNPNFLPEHEKIRQIALLAGIHTHLGFIVGSALFLLGFYWIKNIYLVWAVRLQIKFTVNNQKRYAVALMERYLKKPYLYHVRQNSAVILRNIISGPVIVFSRMFMAVFLTLSEGLTVLGIWILLLFTDFTMSLLIVVLLGLLTVLLFNAFKGRLERKGKEQVFFQAEYMKWVQQGLGSIKDVQVMHRQSYFLEMFRAAYDKYATADAVYALMSQIPRAVIEILAVSGLLLVVVIKIESGANPGDIVGLLGVLTLAAFRLMPSANRILGNLHTIKYHMAGFNEVYDELRAIKKEGNEQRNSETSLPARFERMQFVDQIVIDGVHFSYSEQGESVLKGVSFSIPKGAFVGIIGESGAGKTTFVDVLLGLMEPTGGRILVDGVDTRKDVKAWQNLLAYVPQSIYLIDGPIRDNVALGVREEDIEEADIIHALEMADLYEFVQTLPDGLATRVGERGIMLSGGQRQRIGMARALYEHPEILILDEATSALDNETEKNIMETILKMKGKITIISIAHRESTLEECDFKVRFSEGQAEVINNRASEC